MQFTKAMPKVLEASGLGFISIPFSRFPGYKVTSPIGAKRKAHRIFETHNS
ncbi:MAG TPA: hypothetical protein PKN96_03830 [Flavobacterium sp.]|uniref:hypothetical protein n=1 Tax=Flavobacterium sp. TaxID=239 RepID=UPI002CC9469F|nr:hypothetical protein [Flavobacterium sp.]HNP32396.1 hypothetical protein [Flavobacterium sp.]